MPTICPRLISSNLIFKLSNLKEILTSSNSRNVFIELLFNFQRTFLVFIKQEKCYINPFIYILTQIPISEMIFKNFLNFFKFFYNFVNSFFYAISYRSFIFSFFSCNFLYSHFFKKIHFYSFIMWWSNFFYCFP